MASLELQKYLANTKTERKWRVVSERSNEMLHGFDTDLVVVLRRGTEEEIVLNIEIDGPHHQQVTQKRFDQLRDAYFTRNHGIKVIRLDVMNKRATDNSRQCFQDAYHRYLLQ